MTIVFFSILKLFTIVFFGFYLYRKKTLNEDALSFLTFFVINLTIPFLIFTKITDSFTPHFKPSLLSFIGLSILIFISGLVIGGIISLSAPKQVRREFISLVSFQNCGYLPMNIALFLFPPFLRDKFLIYIFLYILGFNILMWSVGSFFIFKRGNEKFNFKSLLNPPVLSTLIALFFVYTGLKDFIPGVIISPLKIIGDTSFPLSMIILGAWLAKGRIKESFPWILPVLKISLIKLIVIPLIFFLAVWKLKIFSLFGLFIILEASMPSAASLPIVVNLKKANSKFVSQGVFFTHLISIITVPIWVELFLKISGFRF